MPVYGLNYIVNSTTGNRNKIKIKTLTSSSETELPGMYAGHGLYPPALGDFYSNTRLSGK